MAQAITNKKSKIKKIRRSDYPYTVAQAAANGDIATRIVSGSRRRVHQNFISDLGVWKHSQKTVCKGIFVPST